MGTRSSSKPRLESGKDVRYRHDLYHRYSMLVLMNDQEPRGSNSDQVLLYIAVPDLSVEDFHSSAAASTGDQTNPKRGKKVTVNGQQLAVFLYNGLVYAVLEKCPHMGGPLHLGDIEDIGFGEPPRIRCPWHHWCFDLSNGRQVRPQYNGTCTAAFPARITADGQIEVGFTSLHSSYFTNSDF